MKRIKLSEFKLLKLLKIKYIRINERVNNYNRIKLVFRIIFYRFLLSKGHIVIGISKKKEKIVLAKYSKNKFKKNFTFKKIDIKKEFKKVIRIINYYKPSIIINYAALGMVNESWENPDQWFETNVVSFSKIIKEISSFKFIKKFINFSTPEVYGDTLKIKDENDNFNPSTLCNFKSSSRYIFKKVMQFKWFSCNYN